TVSWEPGPGGSHDWQIDESDPFNVEITYPCFDDGSTPSETMWSFYQFLASSSVYFAPVSVTLPSSNSGVPYFLLAGGYYDSVTPVTSSIPSWTNRHLGKNSAFVMTSLS